MKDLKNTITKEISGKELEFRKLSINDLIWLDDNSIDIAGIFSDPIDIVTLSRVLYHQLVDKSSFPLREFVDYCEDGTEIKIQKGGLYHFRELINGQKGVLDSVNIFADLLALSRPELKEENDTEDNSGKK